MTKVLEHQRMAVVEKFLRGISNLSHGHPTEVWGGWGLRVAP
jgi:hypothetical protein